MLQTTWKRCLSLGILLLLGSVGMATAAEIELTPFWGYRVGGDFNDLAVIDEIEIRDGDGYGAVLGFTTSETTQIELLWSRQETDLQVQLPGGLDGPMFGLTVDQYHIGGLYLPETGNDSFRPFVSFSLGVTVFDPSGLDSEDQFSFSLGGGVKYYFGDRLGLRLQIRWTPTYINSTSEGLFCDPAGFCWEVVDNHYLYQTEGSAGLIIKF